MPDPKIAIPAVRGNPLPLASDLERQVAELRAENERLWAEREKFRTWAGAFIVLWGARYAQDQGVPSRNHIHALHYDMMAECGVRMVDFVRWEP